MSATAMKWARLQRLGSPALKSMVNAIAARADEKGCTWASQETLAADMGASARHVRQLLSTLQRLGVITRTVRSAGKKGRLTDLIGLPLHRQFDITSREVSQLRKRPSPTGTRLPLADKSSNRNKTAVATGTRVPGNIKGETSLPYQEGVITNLEELGARGDCPQTKPNVVPFRGAA